MRVVVLGGAGNFGARIVRALQCEQGINLIAAGRRATAVPGAANVPTAVIDIDHPDFAAQLECLEPDLVIHCVGPFQSQDYRVARAALAAGAHYLDLADGRSFVTGFPTAMNDLAIRCGRVAITGASTLSALSTAVVDSIAADYASLESIQVVVAPGQRALRGAATLAAVFSYLGRPIQLWRDGRWQRGWGWMGLRRFSLGFGNRWGALCDVPDLTVLPERYPGLRNASFHAALEIRMQHLVLWMMAGFRRMGVPLPIDKWVAAFDRLASAFDIFGGAWGGMQVQVAGVSPSGTRMQTTWNLQAPALHGPEVPCMAAILLARRLAQGEPFAAGAFTCTGFLSLAEFTPLFARWGITTHMT